MQFHVGCPIWSYKGWVGSFYPSGTRPADYLREYARRLTSIEGNTTFYAVPGEKTLKQWVEETPPSFRFCPKIPKAISHAGKLAGHIAAAHEFIEIMSQLGPRLGPAFLQLPPSYGPAMLDDLEEFLSNWPARFSLALEVRHPQWFDSPQDQRLNALLSKLGMARVAIDTRPIRSLEADAILDGTVYKTLLEARRNKPDVPVIPQRTAGFTFLRYIGHPEAEINAPFIAEWVEYLAAGLEDHDEAYVFCHCPDTRAAPGLCRTFHAAVAKRTPIAPLPWDEADAQVPAQPRLI